MRLSRDDESFGDSVSIEKRTVLTQYVREYPEFHVASEFVDDGWSGTNFDRPQFKLMMEEIEAGNINCIISKDLSRFGREHIMMGYYLEFVFPEAESPLYRRQRQRGHRQGPVGLWAFQEPDK